MREAGSGSGGTGSTWTSDEMDAETWDSTFACLFVVIPLVVIPWRYVWSTYLTTPGDR